MATKKTVVKEVIQPKKLNKWYLFLTQLLNLWIVFINILQSKTLYIGIFLMFICFSLGYTWKYPMIRGILMLEHSNQIESEAQKKKETEDKVKAILSWYKCDSLEAYEAIMETFSPVLVASAIAQESEFNPLVVSKAGALGIFQVMPYHFKSGQDWRNITINIQVGSKLLKEYYDYFNGDISLALASYNAGFPLVKRLGCIPNIKETQDYVIKIDRNIMKVSNL